MALAASFPAGRLGSLMDETLVKRSAVMEEYEAILERIYGGRVGGSLLLRGLVEERRADAYQPPTSELERLARRLTDHPDVPPASHQHPLLGMSGPIVADTFIADWLMIIEVDGRNYHTRKSDFERDRQRDNAAAAMGLVVLRFTWTMVVSDYDTCLETLLAAGRRRARITSS